MRQSGEQTRVRAVSSLEVRRLPAGQWEVSISLSGDVRSADPRQPCRPSPVGELDCETPGRADERATRHAGCAMDGFPLPCASKFVVLNVEIVEVTPVAKMEGCCNHARFRRLETWCGACLPENTSSASPDPQRNSTRNPSSEGVSVRQQAPSRPTDPHGMIVTALRMLLS